MEKCGLPGFWLKLSNARERIIFVAPKLSILQNLPMVL